ncbi:MULTISPECIES: hypothetical protein [unclassified Methylobacterium]|uniref:hypothetical protein n=1 Tax=unclassified Methylobacterium TaxID=2615210 RepID=UPI000EC62CE0|nr:MULTISPECIES: hypothetical protein [unclassified Methylobacterium]GBU19031.1 hypothetical protein AwMethylo_32460 [Methylobacterium sp.]
MIEDACDQGEGLDELLLLRMKGKSDKRVFELVEAALDETQPPSFWHVRPGHEQRIAAAKGVVAAAHRFLDCFFQESLRKPANSQIPSTRLCLQLSIEDYWRTELTERWGAFDGFRTHAFIDARGKARMAFYVGGADEVAFDISGDLDREHADLNVEDWRQRQADLHGVE